MGTLQDRYETLKVENRQLIELVGTLRRRVSDLENAVANANSGRQRAI